MRAYPKENNLERAFIHLTCESSDKNNNDVNNRIPDLRRCVQHLLDYTNDNIHPFVSQMFLRYFSTKD